MSNKGSSLRPQMHGPNVSKLLDWQRVIIPREFVTPYSRIMDRLTRILVRNLHLLLLGKARDTFHQP